MLSIVYITFRENCKFEWFIKSLLNQCLPEVKHFIQIVVVDGILEDPTIPETKRRKYISDCIGNHFEYRHVPPKPTPWQGRLRVTKENYFAAANTRNTGACYAKYGYIAFHDDLGCPSNTWLKAVFEARGKAQIHCGAYTKAHDIVVENGVVTSKRIEPKDVDIRLAHYNQDVNVAVASHFFGSSFCMPLEIYFQLNGINEMFDGNGGEDYEFGIRLIRQGHTIYYNKNMFIYESQDIVGSDIDRTCLRRDPKKNPNDPTSDLSHYLLNYATTSCEPVNSGFQLRDYNHKILQLGMDPIDVFVKPQDTLHFFTGLPISEGLDVVLNNNLFDWMKYLKNNPDLVEAGIRTERAAFRHYTLLGKNESRKYW